MPRSLPQLPTTQPATTDNPDRLMFLGARGCQAKADRVGVSV
ncbi:hypothetical protein I546_3970 [Mycobacterium kansasii 732]|nr:hypothetical protein I546_3970 [Mycobacterium kansasii 732]